MIDSCTPVLGLWVPHRSLANGLGYNIVGCPQTVPLQKLKELVGADERDDEACPPRCHGGGGPC